MTRSGTVSRIDASLAALAAIVGASAWFHPSTAGADLWWHLAAGRRIWETGALPRFDTFSHTFAGRPWTNHEWLWELMYWPVYRLEPDLVACLNLAVLVLVFALVYRLASRTSGSLLAAGAVTWLAAATSHWFLDIRPHLFSLLFTASLLVTRERRWAPWLWPPLFLVWVNLHGGFVFGLGVVGLHVLFRTAEESRRARRIVLPRAEWLGLALSAVAISINPWGYRIFEYPLAYLDSASRFRKIVEWHAPGWSLDPRTFAGRFAWMALVAALGIPRGLRRAPYLVAVAATTFLMASTSRRFIPLFSITAAPIGALGLAMLQERILASRPALSGPWVRRGAVAASLLGALALWHGVRFFPDPLYRWTQGERYPDGAVRYLLALPEPPRHLFNLDTWGGFLMLHAPRIPVFLDGRANTLYDDEIYGDYLRAYAGGAGARELLRKYQVDAVLVPSNSALARDLPVGPEPWLVAYDDPIATLLLPPGRAAAGPPLPDPEAVLAGSPELWLLRGHRALLRGDLDAARTALEHAIALRPLLVSAHTLLFSVAVRRHDRGELERFGRRAIELYPRQERWLRLNLASSYDQLADSRAALGELRRGLPRGPFTPPGPAEAAIRRLERRLGATAGRARPARQRPGKNR
jgi:tetratricopeptide (TPR) repeat protein